MITSFAHDVLQPLVRGESMDRRGAAEALGHILEGRVEGPLVASFLTAFTMKGETIDEMTGFVDAMMAAATHLRAPRDAVDVVGTGGDQLHSVNVSTMAALAVAGCGVPVAKHGNRAASSSVGSADVLEGLGVRLDVEPAVIERCLDEAGMAFIFAPKYHHALGYLTPIRRALSFRTVFNVLGPLANPAGVRQGVIGVSSEQLLEPMAEVLYRRGVDSVTLVHGHDGLDELSVGTSSTLLRVTPDGVTRSVLHAGEELGVHHDVSELRGGDVEVNVQVVHDFLRAIEGPVFDAACANAALVLVTAGRASTLLEGFTTAAQAVRSGAASRVLESMIAVTNAE